MVVKKNKKLELEFKFYLRSSLRIQLTHISEIVQSIVPNYKLYTDPDGFIIDTAYTCAFNKHNFSIPTYIMYKSERDYQEADLFTYFNFLSDKDRYNTVKRLYKYMYEFSQSRIFQYDNTGHVDVNGNTWTLY